MSPAAAPEAPTVRPSLTQLAQHDREQLLRQVRRALPGDTSKRPAVAAFNSSI